MSTKHRVTDAMIDAAVRFFPGGSRDLARAALEAALAAATAAQPRTLTPELIQEIALSAGCTEDDDGALVTRLIRAAWAAAAAAQPSGEAWAWATEDGQRVVPAHTMQTAQRDGGAMLSSMRQFTVKLVPAAPVAHPDLRVAAQAVAEALGSPDATNAQRLAFLREQPPELHLLIPALVLAGLLEALATAPEAQPGIPDPMTMLTEQEVLDAIDGWREFDAPECARHAAVSYGAARAAMNTYRDKLLAAPAAGATEN